ncbi:MAG TPA: hypothetical protein VG871_19050 [Vicinamibacterales bacterium]|nr:hypothetical protein [Vicinamibacterales bacterium]
MRRVSGVVLAAAVLLVPAMTTQGSVYAQEAQPAQAAAGQQQQAGPPKTTFAGDAVIEAFAVNPDKTADYEKVIAALKDALSKSANPLAKQQAAGWKIYQNSTPNPDGSIVYVHVIDPVVKGADYNILNNIYEVVKDPTEQRAMYDLYRGALKQALFIIQGKLTDDLGKP